MDQMRLRAGRYECAHCGEALDMPLMLDPQRVMRCASGMPNVRALLVDGREIHACVLGERDAHPSQGAPSQA